MELVAEERGRIRRVRDVGSQHDVLQAHQSEIASLVQLVDQGFGCGWIDGRIAEEAWSRERVLGSVLVAPAGIPGCLTYRWPKRQICQPGAMNRISFRASSSAWFHRRFPNHLVCQHLGLTGSFDDDYVSRLEDISSPMLLIWSSGDEQCLPEFAEVYRDSVADVDVQMLPDEVGHLGPVVEPGATAEIIGDFVDGLQKSENRDSSPPGGVSYADEMIRCRLGWLT